MLFGCTGYYSYENPYQPDFPGQENFHGPIVHPQKWKKEHDDQILGKKVAIIGSGATAVTILPSISEKGYFLRVLKSHHLNRENLDFTTILHCTYSAFFFHEVLEFSKQVKI